MIRVSRPVLIGAGASVGLVCGLLGAWHLAGPEEPPDRLTVSVLEAPARPEDRLPQAARKSGSAGEFKDPEAARYLGRYAGATYHLVPAVRDGLCLVETRETTVGMSCGSKALSAGVSLGTMTESGQRVVAVVAPDGYTEGVAAGPRGWKRQLVFGRNIAFATVTGKTRIMLSKADAEPIAFTVPDLPAIHSR